MRAHTTKPIPSPLLCASLPPPLYVNPWVPPPAVIFMFHVFMFHVSVAISALLLQPATVCYNSAAEAAGVKRTQAPARHTSRRAESHARKLPKSALPLPLTQVNI